MGVGVEANTNSGYSLRVPAPHFVLCFVYYLVMSDSDKWEVWFNLGKYEAVNQAGDSPRIRPGA